MHLQKGWPQAISFSFCCNLFFRQVQKQYFPYSITLITSTPSTTFKPHAFEYATIFMNFAGETQVLDHIKQNNSC